MTGPDNASKFALEGLVAVLRMEVRPWGLRAILVAPAQTDTELWNEAESALDATTGHAPFGTAIPSPTTFEVLRRLTVRRQRSPISHARRSMLRTMNLKRAALIVTLLSVGGVAVASAADPGVRSPDPPVTPVFSTPRIIDNPYLPLTKFTRCELRGRADDGTRERSVKTLLKEVKPFDVAGRRVEAAVIRDNAYEDGKLVETTLDSYAQADDGTVYYLGEQVKNLKNGKVVDTNGTWLYGRDTDRMGVAMPADPQPGDRYRFEDVPGVTMESNRVEERGLRAQVDGRIVEDVLRIQEFIQPEGVVEYKTYARGVGVIAEYPPGGRVAYAGCTR